MGAIGTRTGSMLLAVIALSGCIPQGGRRPPGDVPPPQRYGPQAASTPKDSYERRSLDQDERVTPTPAPAWEARRVTADARLIQSQTYVVQPGDSLRRISEKTGAGSEAIARENGLVAPYVIRAGQRLAIPGGRYHLVRAGESGIAIARAYSVEWSRVVSANALQEPYILRTGQRLLIPSSGPESLEERAARFRLDIDDILTGGEPALAANARPAKPSPSTTRVLPPTTPVAEPTTRLSGTFGWPASGRIYKRFGPGGSGERSDGIKLAVPLKTPILAAADGVVAYVGSDVPALGGLVILKHGASTTTIYGHAGQLLVKRGQSVKKGQMIGLSGNSGFADRPSLHFEIRQGRTPVDPLTRLPAR